jgi:hypothetical protein
VQFDAPHRTYFTTFDQSTVRLRVLAEIPWLSDGFARTEERTLAACAALGKSRFMALVDQLAIHFGLPNGAVHWDLAEGTDTYNTHRNTQLRATHFSSDSRPAITCDAVLQTPDVASADATLAMLEIRIDTRATHGEAISRPLFDIRFMIDLVAAAWCGVVSDLPLIVTDDPGRADLFGMPHIEVQLQTGNHHSDLPVSLGITDVLDMAPFGRETRRGAYRQETQMRINAALDLSHVTKCDLIAKGFTELAQSWGYVFATNAALLATVSPLK